MENVFDIILDKDETIQRIFRPVKAKYLAKHILACVGIILMVLIPFTLAVIFEGGLPVPAIVAVYCAPAVFAAIWLALALAAYKNLYFCYTDKRILVRSGVFGVDYKALDMSMVGASNVKVSLLDKLLKRNTGTLTFGSMASPMVNGQNGQGGYVLCDVERPYETYRELKEFIQQRKSEAEKK